MRLVQNILSIYYIMSWFTPSKKYDTATDIQNYLETLKEPPINYENILQNSPNDFNQVKLGRYIQSEHFQDHVRNCYKFVTSHIMQRPNGGCVDLIFSKYQIKKGERYDGCSGFGLKSAKLVLSINKLWDRIKNGPAEAEGFTKDEVNAFFAAKFTEILDTLEVNFTEEDFNRVFGTVNQSEFLPKKKGGKKRSRKQRKQRRRKTRRSV